MTNQIEINSTDILPGEVCTTASHSYVDLGVDTTYEIAGFKREYAIVGDAYFATVTAGDTPAWMVDLINGIIDNGLTAALSSVDELKLSILAALAEVDVAKNQYQELVNIDVTIESVIASRLATLNASLANANAQIIELNLAQVTSTQAAAIAVNQISSQLTSPAGVLYGAITNIQTTVSSLNNQLNAKYLELYDLSENTAYVLSVEINRVEASIGDVATALIESMGFALATDVLAVADQVVALTATVDGNYSTVTTQLNATTTQTEANTAAITALDSYVNGNFATIDLELSTFATSLGAVGSRYGVVLTAGGIAPGGGSTFLVGGFELLNDGTDVTAGFDVDQFWIGRSGVNGKRPFVVNGGVVYIDTTVIQDGTITNAKIGNIIQSTSYVVNTSGWQINKNGNAYFNNIYARGDIRASSLVSNLVVTNAIRSSNFNVASPLASPGWGIFEDGRAYFANPVISRPNVIFSGNIVLPAVGSYGAAHYWRTTDLEGATVWVSPPSAKGAITAVYSGVGALRDVEFIADLSPTDFPDADTWTTTGPLLGVSCVVSDADYFYTGGSPGDPAFRVGCRGSVERVGDLTSISFLRIRVVVPFPEFYYGSIRGLQIRNIQWSLLAVS